MRRVFWSIAVCIIGSVLNSPSVSARDAWYPFPVDIWQPPFSKSSTILPSEYTPLMRATQPWKICISFPHMKDAYWLAVNYGIYKEAQRLGVRFTMHEAGGYENLDTQIKQIYECLAENPDGLILSAIDFDGLNTLIENIEARGIPVVDLINGVSSQKVSARSVRPYYDLGYRAGEFLVQHMKSIGWSGPPARVAWFPGPENTGWAQSGNDGFTAAIEGAPIEIISTLYGDTGRPAQAALIEQALGEHGVFDFIVGTTVSAEAAVRILRERDLTDKTGVIAYYFSPGVYRGIQRGVILGAPSDNQAIQGRIALDQVVRILEGAPVEREVAATTNFISKDTIEEFNTYQSLAPLGFRPVFVFN